MDKAQVAEAATLLNDGKIGVMPTDTIFGIVAKASLPGAVERVYAAKQRPSHKPMIVLISKHEQLHQLGVSTIHDSLEKIWPGPYSVIMPTLDEGYEHIHRGTKSIAVRMPKLQWLCDLIDQTGPIIATSANRSGEAFSEAIDEIEAFLPGLDFYFDGAVQSQPSQLCLISDTGEVVPVDRDA